jgi:hypothetical protein
VTSLFLRNLLAATGQTSRTLRTEIKPPALVRQWIIAIVMIVNYASAGYTSSLLPGVVRVYRSLSHRVTGQRPKPTFYDFCYDFGSKAMKTCA